MSPNSGPLTLWGRGHKFCTLRSRIVRLFSDINGHSFRLGVELLIVFLQVTQH